MILFTTLSVLLLTTPLVLGCGYRTCPQVYNTSKVQLHIIAHSHDDVGWLKTADKYYDDDVGPLLSNVVDALKRNPKRTFVEVEMYYFRRWWQRQSSQTQTLVHKLVESGQLAFANGGWCINDEAAAYYNSIIDQMTFGIDFIRQTFGECAEPKVSWQIDPFGASSEMAHLYSLMNFDGHIVNRGDMKGEFLWKTGSHSIFTSKLHNHYSAPHGFNFDDEDEITDSNKLNKAKELAELGKRWNKDYGSKGHVLITFGDDFRYKNAERYFSNLDRLIEVVNQNHPDVNLFYSSPHCYVKAVRDLKPKLEVRTRDYFPLWTGFYTSRPIVKYLDRYSNNLLQAAKQLEVIAELSDMRANIFEGQNEMGVIQHHDAITGTSKPNVMFDYRQRQVNMIKALSEVISGGLQKLSRKNVNTQHDDGRPLIYTTANISDFETHLSKNSFAAIVWNPLAHEQQTWLRIPLNDKHNYRVFDVNGTELKTSVVPINAKVRSMVGHHKEITHELVFNARLPALGFNSFLAEKQTDTVHKNNQSIAVNADGDLLLKGKGFNLALERSSGKTKYIERNQQRHRLSQSYHYYISAGTSSSYEFCPSLGAVDISDYGTKLISATQYDGFAEVTQQVYEWVWQTIRVYEDREYAEIDWVVGPISENNKIGKDVIVRFDTDLNTNSTFLTDANGRQNIERHRDERLRECHGTMNAISYNYYPINSRVILRDQKSSLQLTVLTDRSVGTSSLTDGQVELMLHRRLFDRQTSDIPVDDLDIDGQGIVARGKLFLLLDSFDQAADRYRPLAQQIAMQPVIALRPFDGTSPKYRNEYNMKFTGIRTAIPEKVNLLTLENFGKLANNEVVVRFENYFETSDQTKFANENVSLPLDIFANLHIDQVKRSNLVVGERRDSELSEKVAIDEQDIVTLVLKVRRNISEPVCDLNWQKLVGHQLPKEAIRAGYDLNHNQTLYICRHQNIDLIPGKYSEKIKCHISYGGTEIQFDDAEIEVLTSGPHDQHRWVPRHGGDAIPDSAFVAGLTKDGKSIHIGRCHMHGLTVGKIDQYFYYGFGDKEYKDCPNHEILVC